MKTTRLAVRRNFIALALLVFSCNFTYAQPIWKPSRTGISADYSGRAYESRPAEGSYQFFDLDIRQLQKQILVSASNAGRGESPRFTLPMPNAGGGWLQLEAEESSIVTERVAAQAPHVKTYIIRDVSKKTGIGRITITDSGITGLLFTENGTQYIHPIGNNDNTHITYKVRDLSSPAQLSCDLDETLLNESGRNKTMGKAPSGDGKLRTYRAAIAATGEYVSWAGGTTNALGYIITTMNTVNAIYERDAGIRLILVSGTETMFTNAATDPFGDDLDGNALLANNNTLNSILGSSGYDVGMVFNNKWSGGLAYMYSVCTTLKGGAGSGITFGTGSNPVPGPQGPIFEQTVAHEFGHQFGAGHTMSASNGGCNGNTMPASAWEPGGGSTIMAYAGTCTGNYYQPRSDHYFHAGSIAQIIDYTQNDVGNTCAVIINPKNNIPDVTVTSGTSFTIPVNTPFVLTANGTDANTNQLTYAWDQMDANLISSLPPNVTSTSGPLFRSFPPSDKGTRYFPNLKSLLTNTATPYEVLPWVPRTFNLRVQVRDNNPGAGASVYEDVVVNTTYAAGTFAVTSQSTPVTYTADGANTMTITWNVAGTNGAPFNAANVQVLYTNNEGASFHTLVESTANDGEETIVVPNIPGAGGRIMVKAVGNIFFQVNAAPIEIISGCRAEAAELYPSNTVTANPGSEALNLAIGPKYGTAVFPASATISGANPVSYLAYYNYNTLGCSLAGNAHHYQVFEFIPSVSGSYTFSKNNAFAPIALYDGNFDANNVCSDFVNSTSSMAEGAGGLTLSNTLTATLTAGKKYVLTVGSFHTETPAFPFTVNITVTAAPAGATLSDGHLNPGVGFDYGYVIINNATGKVVAVQSTPDLSDHNLYTNGVYTVYGFSYDNSNFTAGDLAAYVGGDFSALTQDLFNNPGTNCGVLSRNAVTVNIFGTLPVEILPLTAQVGSNNILLNWATAMEQNSDHFEIERSADGRNFVAFGTVGAAGESNSRINYSWNDESPFANANYYRIKVVSRDGSVQYSNVVLVRLNVATMQVQLYPNPTNDNSKLQLQSPVSGRVKISVYNAMGQVVLQQNGRMVAGTSIIDLNLGRQAAGTYMVLVQTDTETKTVQLVKK